MLDSFFRDPCGLFCFPHMLYIVLFAGLLLLLLHLTRQVDPRQANRLLLWSGLAMTALEVLKIFLRIRRGLGPDSWVPLYYCSLYLYAIWMIRLPWRSVRRAGFAYLTMGGILASVCFTFYPSTALGMYPFFSTAVLHSFVFHLVMCFSGLLILRSGLYKPEKKDSFYYFVFIIAACCSGVWVNARLGTNCMFLDNPFGLPVLQPLLAYSRPLYRLLVTFAQACGMFWINYGVYARLHVRHSIPRELPVF